MLNQFKISLVFVIVSLGQICMAQTAFSDKESLIMLENDTIKREIASFSIKGASIIKSESLSNKKLQEIRLSSCSDKDIHFSKVDFFSTSIYIDIEVEEEISGKKIKRFGIIYHDKAHVPVPHSAFTDIQQPKFCDKFTKKGKPIMSNCKAFLSKDRRRLYIYMLNGEEANRYEVIWVIQDFKYYTRVIDYVP